MKWREVLLQASLLLMLFGGIFAAGPDLTSISVFAGDMAAGQPWIVSGSVKSSYLLNWKVLLINSEQNCQDATPSSPSAVIPDFFPSLEGITEWSVRFPDGRTAGVSLRVCLCDSAICVGNSFDTFRFVPPLVESVAPLRADEGHFWFYVNRTAEGAVADAAGWVSLRAAACSAFMTLSSSSGGSERGTGAFFEDTLSASHGPRQALCVRVANASAASGQWVTGSVYHGGLVVDLSSSPSVGPDLSRIRPLGLGNGHVIAAGSAFAMDGVVDATYGGPTWRVVLLFPTDDSTPALSVCALQSVSSSGGIDPIFDDSAVGKSLRHWHVHSPQPLSLSRTTADGDFQQKGKICLCDSSGCLLFTTFLLALPIVDSVSPDVADPNAPTNFTLSFVPFGGLVNAHTASFAPLDSSGCSSLSPLFNQTDFCVTPPFPSDTSQRVALCVADGAKTVYHGNILVRNKNYSPPPHSGVVEIRRYGWMLLLLILSAAVATTFV